MTGNTPTLKQFLLDALTALPNGEDMLTEQEAADFTGLAVNSFMAYRSKNKADCAPYVMKNRKPYYKRKDLAFWQVMRRK